jgi:hypothetical protein
VIANLDDDPAVGGFDCVQPVVLDYLIAGTRRDIGDPAPRDTIID